ncbi:hypothetical protein L596_012793 [Steinernema carpocapsae]|uniref:Uncharacterized protein n=1 Tax=Steinernema carpocapsae TaxID=34508 RepID=A0A4U5NYS5_STECR|nr:hypothetical protein L596_012793 [Steinernema carpocapsae]
MGCRLLVASAEGAVPSKGKNPFLVENEKTHRRPSQVDRALHRIYATPRPVFGVNPVDKFLARIYWSIRSLQFRLFYKDEEPFLHSTQTFSSKHGRNVKEVLHR